MSVSPELETVRFAGHGGDEVAARFAAAAGPHAASSDEDGVPGLLLIHEVFGLEPHTDDLVRRFAEAGFAVLAPDLWFRQGRPGPEPSASNPAPVWEPEAIRAAVDSLPDRRALGDLEAGLTWLSQRDDVDPERLAAVGFCMGGNLAFQLACTSRRLAAAVDFYGRIAFHQLSANHPIQPLELGLNLSCPVLFHFGSEDASIPEEQVALLEDTLGRWMKDIELERWPGAGHGFLTDRRGGYHEVSARAAWKRTVDFLNARLEPE